MLKKIIIFCAGIMTCTTNFGMQEDVPENPLITFIAQKRTEAAENKDRMCLEIFAKTLGYGDIKKEDLQLLIDFIPQDTSAIREIVSLWQQDKQLSTQRKSDWQGKNMAKVVDALKESKISRLKEKVADKVTTNTDMYALMRDEKVISKDEARNMIIQDLADLYMFETEIQETVSTQLKKRLNGFFSNLGTSKSSKKDDQ